MLDPSEASKHQLNVNTDKNKLSKSFCSEEDRLTVVAFEKTNDSPCAITMLKTLNDLSLMEPLPSLEIHRDILHTTCKTMWELSYGIQRIDKKAKCLGDICIATGLEMLYNLNLNERHGNLLCTFAFNYQAVLRRNWLWGLCHTDLKSS